MSGLRPIGLLVNDFQPKLVKRDVRVRRFEVQIRRDRSAIDRQGRLDQSDDTRGGFQMPEVGLDGTGEQRRSRLSAPPVHRPESPRFNGIAK